MVCSAGCDVEVCLRNLPFDCSAWYDATFRDLSSTGCIVLELSLADKEGASCKQNRNLEVDASQVRLPPSNQDEAIKPELFEPKVDELVEVQRPAAKGHPANWTLGTVRVIRGQFFYVSLLGHRRAEDVLVRRSQIRRPNQGQLLGSMELVAKVIQLPLPKSPDLAAEFDASVDWLQQVKDETGLLSIDLQSMQTGEQIRLVGSPTDVSFAQSLLNSVHLKHRAEIIQSKLQAARWERQLDKEVPQSDTHFFEFNVDESDLGRVIGKNGGNLRQVQEDCGVRVEVEPRGLASGSFRKVRVWGPTAEAVESARVILEIVRIEVPLMPHQIGFVLGKGIQNLIAIAKQAKLIQAHFNPDSQAVELLGTAESVISAKMLIETHADYQGIYLEMKEETTTLRRSFQALDALAAEKHKQKHAKKQEHKQAAQVKAAPKKVRIWSSKGSAERSPKEDTHNQTRDQQGDALNCASGELPSSTTEGRRCSTQPDRSSTLAAEAKSKQSAESSQEVHVVDEGASSSSVSQLDSSPAASPLQRRQRGKKGIRLSGGICGPVDPGGATTQTSEQVAIEEGRFMPNPIGEAAMTAETETPTKAVVTWPDLEKKQETNVTSIIPSLKREVAASPAAEPAAEPDGKPQDQFHTSAAPSSVEVDVEQQVASDSVTGSSAVELPELQRPRTASESDDDLVPSFMFLQ
eukprot:TRINITY_DN9303_c3_g1_i1.p1 TRINITY_DN9303_c3_g1~~TRINITY_DN9303_c3_g1_i1.p1  ORF type:complete len:691 (-),score=154.84 TRINITY_DN9303_c3_g1_i1:111-2183(-)